METLLLRYRGRPIREYPLDGPLEVGRGPLADVVVHDPAVPDHAWVIQPGGGTVWLHPVAEGVADRTPRVLPAGEPLPLGGEYAVERVWRERSPRAGGTDPGLVLEPAPRLSLVVGTGGEARSLRVGRHPVRVGSARDNDLVLHDTTVSAHHLRFDPAPSGLVVRDLGSRNGTWVNGVRARVAHAREGALVRAGRTTLSLVGAGDGRGAGLVAASPAMLGIVAEAERLAGLGLPVLVLGESGAGKEELARVLHERSPRRGAPFVAVNAGGLPATLVESELFGHERGAFTGAAATHRGAFEQAHGGTLFLDEIGEVPLELQARLLRVLDCWEVRRVGAERATRVDVRLVCATHRDLRAMVAAGAFRHDLYYRVARLVLEVPPLRARPEDIAPLARHFLGGLTGELAGRQLTPGALARLEAYPWPGNARELRNVLEVAAVHAGGEALEDADVERALARVIGPGAPPRASAAGLRRVVDGHRGNLSAAARSLGIPRSTLRDRLRAAGPAETRGGHDP